MIRTNIINIIGDSYNAEDQIIDTVEHVYGVKFVDNDGWVHIYETGDSYMDGVIEDIFTHPESDCVWMVVECNDVYFEIGFDDNDIRNYSVYSEPLPFD